MFHGLILGKFFGAFGFFACLVTRLLVQDPADRLGCPAVVLCDCMRVYVHGQARGRMPQPVLDRLDVGAVADEQGRLGVAKLVEVQAHVFLLALTLAAG